MVSVVKLLIIALALARLRFCIAWQRATSPRLDNLTETEARYAKIYWNYNPFARVVHANWTDREFPKASRINLGYRYVVPLAERLAGLSYVGHAARLRLVLERARNGEALMVGALGGSITFGQAVGGWKGSYVKLFMDWLNAALPPQHYVPVWAAASSAGNSQSREMAEKHGAAATAAGAAAVEAGDAVAAAAAAVRQTQAGQASTEDHRRLRPAVASTTEAQRERTPQAAASGVKSDPAGAGSGTQAAGRRRVQGAVLRGDGRCSGEGGSPIGAAGKEVRAVRRRRAQEAQEIQKTQEAQEAAPRVGSSAGSVQASETKLPSKTTSTSTMNMSTDSSAATARHAAKEQHQQQRNQTGPIYFAMRMAGRMVGRRQEGDWRQHIPHHDFLNGAVPGTQSSYMSSCLQYHLPPAVDIVFVEYAANDSPAPKWNFEDPARRAMERLIRKLLRLPSKPAVVLVNMYAIGAAHYKYWYTAERDFMDYATYYSLPAVSLKAAVMPSATVNGSAAVSYGAVFNGGFNHPGRGGHVVAAELLITLCRNLLLDINDDAGRSDPWVAPAIDGADSTSDAGANAEALVAVAHRPLPLPLTDGNYESSESTCYIEHDLQSLVQEPLAGWEWTDEGRGKWGYVATAPGKTLRMKVNTRLMGNRSAEHAAAAIVLQIAYLQSYLGVGTVRVVCMEGCRCRPLTIDAYDSRQVSVTSMADVKVTQHPECIISFTTKGPSQAAIASIIKMINSNVAPDSTRITVNGSIGAVTKNGSVVNGTMEALVHWNKFKLMGVVVGEEPGAPEGGVTWFRNESHEMAQVMRQVESEQESDAPG